MQGSDSGNWPTSSLKIIADLAVDINGVTVHKIAVSETGHIAILSDSPNVAVTKNGNVKYFGQDKRPSDLNFITRKGKEFLIVVYGQDGNVTLWDMDADRSHVVFQTSETTPKVMALIDDNNSGNMRD